jgi:hypothetical protein
MPMPHWIKSQQAVVSAALVCYEHASADEILYSTNFGRAVDFGTTAAPRCKNRGVLTEYTAHMVYGMYGKAMDGGHSQ